MAVTSLIIVESVLFTILLISISIVIKDKSISRNDEGLSRFLLFAYAYMIGIIGYIAVYFWTRVILLSDICLYLSYGILIAPYLPL